MNLKPGLFSALFLIFSFALKAQSPLPKEDTSVTALANKLHISPQQALKIKQRLDSQQVAIRKRVTEDLKQKEKSFKQQAIAQLSDSLRQKKATAFAATEKTKMQQAAFTKSVTEDRKTVSKPVVAKKPRGL